MRCVSRKTRNWTFGPKLDESALQVGMAQESAGWYHIINVPWDAGGG